MRVLILNSDYPKFLNELYSASPGLSDETYAAQMSARNDSLFGVADFYSRNFQAFGNAAVEIHVNNPWLQYAWARENGLSIEAPTPARRGRLKKFLGRASGRIRSTLRSFGSASGLLGISEWERRVLSAQIEDFKPDIILNQEMYLIRGDFLGKVKGRSKIVGQNAAILPAGESYKAYDLLISSLPNYVEIFRRAGVRSALNRLAFEPTVLDKLGPPLARDIPLSFVGSLSPDHAARIKFLEYIAIRSPLLVWGNGIERLPRSSPLHARYQGEAWGRNMFNILRRSKITLNKHIDIAAGMANNMRLYEATGMGALLLTDAQTNLHEIFSPGEHVVSYLSAEDCIAQIGNLFDNESRRAKIAAAGQQHAINVQNYHSRVKELIALFETL